MNVRRKVLHNMKPILYLDYDGVIVNTIKQIVKMYNDDFCLYPDYTIVDWEDIKSWDFEECTCASKEYLNSYFNQPRFFTEVEWMPGCLPMIQFLSTLYTIKIVTMGNEANFKGKKYWFTQHNYRYHSFDDIIFIPMDEYKDKSHIDMSGGIFVDDSANNLITSNADLKICYGKKYPWNEGWKGKRCEDWIELYNIIIRYREVNNK